MDHTNQPPNPKNNQKSKIVKYALIVSTLSAIGAMILGEYSGDLSLAIKAIGLLLIAVLLVAMLRILLNEHKHLRRMTLLLFYGIPLLVILGLLSFSFKFPKSLYTESLKLCNEDELSNRSYTYYIETIVDRKNPDLQSPGSEDTGSVDIIEAKLYGPDNQQTDWFYLSKGNDPDFRSGKTKFTSYISKIGIKDLQYIELRISPIRLGRNKIADIDDLRLESISVKLIDCSLSTGTEEIYRWFGDGNGEDGSRMDGKVTINWK